MLASPADALPEYPAPGESLHYLLDRRWEMAAVIVSAVRRKPVFKLRIATLSIGLPQLAVLVHLHEHGGVVGLTLVVSDYFAKADKEIHAKAVAEFERLGPWAKLASCRCHAKVVAIEYQDGDTLAIEGSANLRANKNFEQIAVVNDRGLHDFHAGWIDEVVRQYAATQIPEVG